MKLELTKSEARSLFAELEKEIQIMRDYCDKYKFSIEEAYGEYAVHLEQIYLKLKKGLEQ